MVCRASEKTLQRRRWAFLRRHQVLCQDKTARYTIGPSGGLKICTGQGDYASIMKPQTLPYRAVSDIVRVTFVFVCLNAQSPFFKNNK